LHQPKIKLAGLRGVTLFLRVPCIACAFSDHFCRETQIFNAALMVGENPSLPAAAHFLFTIAV